MGSPACQLSERLFGVRTERPPNGWALRAEKTSLAQSYFADQPSSVCGKALRTEREARSAGRFVVEHVGLAKLYRVPRSKSVE